jgi:hypothetical protein
MHALLVVLRATLRPLGDVPTRSVMELATRLGVAEAETSALVEPTAGSPPPAALPTVAAVPVRVSPLLATMGPDGASSVPRIRLSRRATRAARKHPIR